MNLEEYGKTNEPFTIREISTFCKVANVLDTKDIEWFSGWVGMKLAGRECLQLQVSGMRGSCRLGALPTECSSHH